jgi:cell division protein ZapE
VPLRLVDRVPVIRPAELVAGLIPPPRFAAVRFETYRPDPAQPSQAAALAAVRGFARPSRAASRLRRAKRTPAGGIYLDGGFGVGKTHLLASLWQAYEGPKAYTTFGELTHLVGAVGFAGLVTQLSGMRLLAIDEFELDDPGDTVLVSSLLGRLADAGVALAATSNTLPDRLGTGRFNADDFRREIQGLSARFVSVRIDGPDYRHRGVPAPPTPATEEEVRGRAAARVDATLDDFTELLAHLATLRPSRYGALLDGVGAVYLTGVGPVADEHVALRLVVLADRLYDRRVELVTSGAPLDRLFDARMLTGGYRLKYHRAISRLVALARAGAATGVRAQGG